MQKKFKRAVLHFGCDKTGSTSIQHALSNMRDELVSDQRVAYPPPESWHAALGSFFCDNPEHYIYNTQRGISSKNFIEQESTQYIENIKLWLSKIPPCECLVFSYEGFVDLDITALNRFRDFCNDYADSVEVVLYVRPPLSYAISAISQRMKQGATTVEMPVSPYKAYLEKICEAFGKRFVIVRPFVPALLKDEDVVADFADILGVPSDYFQTKSINQNESLSVEATFIGNIVLNKLAEQRATFTQEEFYSRIGSLLSAIPGQKIKLTKSQISEVLTVSFEHTEYLKNEFDIVFNESEQEYLSHDDVSDEKEAFLNSIGEVFAKVLTNGFIPRELRSEDILVAQALLHEGYEITQNQLLMFEVPFSVTRPIQELEMGIHIFDENKKWAFGTNSTLLKQVQQNVETGNYRVFHRIIANLPVGTYTAGFTFAERTETGVTELYWTDAACEFRVNRVQSISSVGYSDLPATISIISDKNTDNAIVENPRGRIDINELPSAIICNETISLAVTVYNEGVQPWQNGLFRPVRVSYHWQDTEGQMIEFDGLRTCLSDAELLQNSSCSLSMDIKNPEIAGRYVLILTLVQENTHWFEEVGFEPTKITVDVVEK